MFTSIPSYDRYRALKLRDPRTRGEDVYALQTLVLALGHDPHGLDGIFGPATKDAVVNAQRARGIVADGIVGPQTWLTLGKFLAPQYAEAFGVPWELMQGQVEHESSWRGGIYSPLRDDGTYDAGVAQRNTKYTPPQQGFNVPQSIEAICKNTRAYFDLFDGLEHRRRWTLAAGAWNAPSFACWFARAEGATKVKASMTAKPGPTSTDLFNAYCASVTAYMSH